MIRFLVVVVAVAVCRSQACHRDSCRYTRLQCRNNGVVDPADCLDRIGSGCGTEAWNRTATCRCPEGYYGTECQLTANRNCMDGYVYSYFGLSKQGLVESECFLDYFGVLDTYMLFFRHHRIRLLTDVKAGTANVTLFTRSGSKVDFYRGRCTKTIEMFTFNAYNCRTRSRTLDGQRQIVMHCPDKQVVSCMDPDRPQDREGCPSLGVRGFQLWGRDPNKPIVFVFVPGPVQGQFRLELALDSLPIIRSLTLTGTCNAGQCIKTYDAPADVDLDSFEVETAPDPGSASSFVGAFVALAFVGGLVLALAAAVAHVTAEAHRPIKDVFDRSASSSSTSLTAAAAPADPGPGRVQRGIFWDSLTFVLRGPAWAAWVGGRSQRQILQPSTVKLVGPELVALIGRSGCGKSTLLDLLAGVYKSGSIQGDRGLIGRRTSVGYVTQNDVLLPALTVWETVEFAARARSPPDLPGPNLRWKVAAVLADLGLENQAASMAASLSGGEMRRLALAADLICSPDVLLLDEPTTGLDSTNASLIVNVLRKHVVLYGRLVLMTIHQPARELFPLFDRVILMGPGGRIVYNGAPDSAIEYIARHVQRELAPGENPFEFILEALDDGDNVDVMFGEFSSKEAETAADLSLLEPLPERPLLPSLPFFRQVAILCQRSFRNSARSSRHLALYYVVTVVVALFLGLSFLQMDRDLSGAQSRLGFFSCSALFLSLISLASLDMMIHERIIQRKETPRCYTAAAYIVSKLATDVVPYRVIPALLYAAITYGMVGLRAGMSPFLMFALTVVLISVAAGAGTMLVSLVAARFRTANMVAVLYYLFNFCLGSSLVSRLNAGVLAWLRYLAVFNYATEALCAIEFDGLTITVVNDFTGHQPFPIDGGQFLLQTGMRVDNLVADVLALVACILVLYAGCLLAVYLDRRKTRRHQSWIDPDHRA